MCRDWIATVRSRPFRSCGRMHRVQGLSDHFGDGTQAAAEVVTAADGAVLVETEGMGGLRSAAVHSTVGVRRQSSSPSASGGWSGDIGGPLAAKAAAAALSALLFA